jgi:hypothetical protein
MCGFPRDPKADRRAVVPLWRKVDRLRTLDEAAAYARCHGDRDDSVRVVKLPPRRARYDLLATGEEIRRRLEERIDARDADATLTASPTPIA